MRDSWDEVWLNVAIDISKRSNCTGRQVGAVIVSPSNRPIAVGYNGPPANMKRPVDGNCSGYCPRSGGDRGTAYDNCVSVHAEANALLFADRDAFVDGTIYVTNPCCWGCAKLISNSGIKRVIVRKSAVDNHADVDGPVAFMQNCGLEVVVLENNNN